MTEILGKVITGSHDIPRGADVSLRIEVPASWLNEGRSIEVELPRNLACAKCSGGGCSACHHSGAISVRGKLELPEMLRVVLPLSRSVDRVAQQRKQQQEAEPPESYRKAGDRVPESVRPIVIRIPECGGLPNTSKGEAVRGMLMLAVAIGAEPSRNVRCLSDDDAVDSSQMLRAEVRTNRPCHADSDPPPSSRVARVSLMPRARNATTHPPATQQGQNLHPVTPPASPDVDASADSAEATGEASSLAITQSPCEVTQGNAAKSAETDPLRWFAVGVGFFMICALLTMLLY